MQPSPATILFAHAHAHGEGREEGGVPNYVMALLLHDNIAYVKQKKELYTPTVVLDNSASNTSSMPLAKDNFANQTAGIRARTNIKRAKQRFIRARGLIS